MTVSATGIITLHLSFRVRAKVAIGVQALRGKTVVSSSGIKHFAPKSGTLSLILSRKHWPTKLRFVTPPAAKTADPTAGS